MCRAVVAGLTKVLYKVSTRHEASERLLMSSGKIRRELVACSKVISRASGR